MLGRWTLGKRLGAGFALAGLVLLTIAVVSHQSIEELIESNRAVTHTQHVRRELALLLSQLTDAETGQRGHSITGNEAFLDPYRNSVSEVGRTLERLRALTAGNPGQAQRLRNLAPRIEQRLAFLSRLIELRRKAGLDAVVDLVSDAEGKRQMEDIRAAVAELDREQRELLELRNARAEASARTTENIIVGGGILGVLLVVLAGWLIVSSLSRQISSAVYQVQSSSAELQAAASQQATGAKEQATAMNEITTTISELLATSRQIAESAQRVAQIAEQTASAARTGDGTLDKAQESISGIRRQVDSIVQHMLELGRKSQQIGAVLEIVSELAEQTNILAINATIEAAGAGEAGKRFAVVADEIRKLADRVSGSTKEIRTLIDDVRSAVNTTVMATETGSKAVDAGSRQFGEVAVSFKQIAALVATTTEASREIGLSTKQQTTAVEQVNLAIASVAQATRENEASSEQTLKTATQLAGLSKDLMGIIRARAA